MKTHSATIVHENPIFRVEEREIEYEGGVRETHWVVIRKPGVQVVALNKNNKILLVKERREPKTEFSINLPGGKAEQFDTDLEILKSKALVELEEEVGYKTSSAEFLMKDSRMSSWLERDFYVFVAWDAEYVGPHPEKGEEIIPFALTPREIEKMTMNGEFPDYLVRILNRAIGYFREKGVLPD